VEAEATWLFHSLCEGLAAMDLRSAMPCPGNDSQPIWADALGALVAGWRVTRLKADRTRESRPTIRPTYPKLRTVRSCSPFAPHVSSNKRIARYPQSRQRANKLGSATHHRPRKIGDIANAALILTHFEHRYVSC
jgi:hypothetical protein